MKLDRQVKKSLDQKIYFFFLHAGGVACFACRALPVNVVIVMFYEEFGGAAR
jgi:hypothetical protein